MISGNKKVPFPTISTMLFQIPMRKQGVKMSCSGNFNFRVGDKYSSFQTLVPCIFSYLPVGLILLCPFADIVLGAYSNVLVMSAALFPALDGFLIIYFVKRFR